MAASSNSNDRFGINTLPQTFEIGSDFSKSHRADKSSQRACRGRTIRGGSDGLLTTASHQGTLYRRESNSERSPHFFFFFFTKAPMTRVTT
jgi:hypothetical protein